MMLEINQAERVSFDLLTCAFKIFALPGAGRIPKVPRRFWYGAQQVRGTIQVLLGAAMYHH